MWPLLILLPQTLQSLEVNLLYKHILFGLQSVLDIGRFQVEILTWAFLDKLKDTITLGLNSQWQHGIEPRGNCLL